MQNSKWYPRNDVTHGNDFMPWFWCHTVFFKKNLQFPHHQLPPSHPNPPVVPKPLEQGATSICYFSKGNGYSWLPFPLRWAPYLSCHHLSWFVWLVALHGAITSTVVCYGGGGKFYLVAMAHATWLLVGLAAEHKKYILQRGIILLLLP